MKAIMNDGTIVEIDTSFMFNNQYDTTNGMRIHDTQIKQIIDDIRLGEFYCSSVKQGTYEEVQKAIDEERAKINQCEKCRYNQINGRIEERCSKERIENSNEVIIKEVRAYKKECTYKDYYNTGKKCAYDIEEKPRLFREVADCFFCNHPEGVPDMSNFVSFMLKNHEEYNIVSYWSDEPISESKSFKYSKKFASYKFEKSAWSNYFELLNARNHFKFIFDFDTKTFILCDGIGYEEVKRFETSTYDSLQKKSISMPITGWDKFYKWFMTMVDDYLSQK